MSVISLEEAKLFLRVDTDDDNSLISSFITTAEHLVMNFTGRVLLTSDFTYVLDAADRIISVPFSPLQEITKIEVISEDGIVQEVDRSIYDVDISGKQVGRIQLKQGQFWPEHRGFASFKIYGKAGYGDAPEAVPEPLRQAILNAIAMLYDQRGNIEQSKIYDVIASLCWPYKVLWI